MDLRARDAVAARRALRIAPELELAELRRERVVDEQPARERVADAEDQLDRLGRLEDAEAIEEISASELKRRLDKGEALEVIDVRDPHEWDIVRIPGTRLVPLGSLSEHLHEFDSSKTYVMHCKSGVRSAKAIAQLRRAGFRRLLNLRGGVLAWAREVDPSLPTY